MNSIIKIAITTTMLLSTLTVSAAPITKKIALKFHGEHLRGQNIIGLKKEVKSQFPNINLNNFRLDRVLIVAKSKQGKGKALLQVGEKLSRSETIGGRAYDFHDPSRQTFSRLVLDNPAHKSTRGAIKLHLKGNIKLKRVVLELMKKRSPRRVVFQVEGTEKIDKLVEEVVTFSPYQSNVKEVRLSSKKANIEVLRAVVLFNNGERRVARELMGKIRKGSSKSLVLSSNRGRKVDSIRIKAVSPSIIGSRGILKLELGVLK